MKSFVLLVAVLSTPILKAQTSDSTFEDVKITVNNYFVGWKNKDADLLRSIFHPESKLKYINRDSKYEHVEIEKHINDITAADNKFLPPHIRDFTTINVFGDGAYAQVHLRFRTFEVMDFFNLLRIEGVWKIVNKVSVSNVLPPEVTDKN